MPELPYDALFDFLYAVVFSLYSESRYLLLASPTVQVSRGSLR